MAHQSLYRRYRPQRFGEVRGQDHLVRALQGAVRDDRVGHAYLFSGPRGTGKTTSARILAKALNCADLVDGEPCGVCASCVAIAEGTSFDVHELDAASNNKVEDIRELVNHAALGTPGRTKVYILDEVHMLTGSAANALLKTLEEPPSHVVFVLATTDPQKVLPTIRSRCQHFEVHLLGADELEALVRDVAADAGIALDDDAVAYVVRHGGGSARDTLSLLDQVAAAGGLPDDADGVLDRLVDALAAADTRAALVAVEEATSSGRSPRLLGEELLARLRDVFLTALDVDLPRLTDLERTRVGAQAAALGPARATRAIEVVGEAFVGIGDAPDQRVVLEAALVRLTRAEADTSPAALVDRITRLERAMARGGLPATEHGAPLDAAAPVAHPEGADAATGDPAPPVDDHPGGPAAAARAALAATRAAAGDPPRARAGRAAAPAAAAAAPRAEAARAAEAAALATGPAEPARGADAPPTPGEPAASTSAHSSPQPATEPDGVAPGAPGVLGDASLRGAWKDVLAAVPALVRSRYAGATIVAVEGSSVLLSLPNQVHHDRCAEVRAEVEAALRARFGDATRLELSVAGADGGDAATRTAAGAARPSSPRRRAESAARSAAASGDAGDLGPSPDAGEGGGAAAPAPATAPAAAHDADDEAIDPAELRDAPDAASTQLDLVLQTFPGAEHVPADPT